MTPLLECRGIKVGYTGSPVLEDIDFAIGEGEIVTLVGANGAGKSTLVKTISGLMKPMAGEIRFKGDRIDQLSAAERLRRGIAHVPEGRQVFAGMTVAENLHLGAYVRRDATDTRLGRIFEQYPFLSERMHDVVENFSAASSRCSPSRAGSCPSRRSCCSTSRRWGFRRSWCSKSSTS
ncbi:MAG TPA: ATP-binding cassette domain-containing protein [Gemmatimonadaceae bacterium]